MERNPIIPRIKTLKATEMSLQPYWETKIDYLIDMMSSSNHQPQQLNIS